MSRWPPATAQARMAEAAQITVIVGAPCAIRYGVSIQRVLMIRPDATATSAMISQTLRPAGRE